MKKVDYSVLLYETYRRNFINKAISKFGSQVALATYLNKKVKGRKVIRENIKDWIEGRHKYGWNIFIPANILNELAKINNTNLKEVLKNAIKFNPAWNDPNNIKKQVKPSKKPKIILKRGRKYLDISSILPDKTLKSKRSGKKLPLFSVVNKKTIRLWSEGNWQKSSIKLKRFVELDRLFFIGCAIYASEGVNKIGRDNTSISLGNSEPSIMNLFFKWLNLFLSDYKKTVKIDFNGKVEKPWEVVSFWKTKVHYLKEREIPIIERKELRSNLITNMGVLNIKISNTILKPFVLKLVKTAQAFSLSKREYAWFYLRGLMASEGSVSKNKLKEVTIGCKYGKERRFIEKLLNNLNLKYTSGINQLSITHWNSFYKLYKNDVFCIPQINSISKESYFIMGFKLHQTTKSIMRLKKFYGKKFTAKDWQKEFELKRYISAHNFLNRFVKVNILVSDFDKNVKFYYLNPNKIKFLEDVWNINNL